MLTCVLSWTQSQASGGLLIVTMTLEDQSCVKQQLVSKIQTFFALYHISYHRIDYGI